ncbi:MAG: molybdate ABC transporter permease subunit [Nitrospina sp.]|nr:molybdate ABC transporter permease subunit [Nitrospina sp.]MBT6600903.1 molybdate ABC transporter permease subunit [Nitrospina sp.]
MNLFSFDFQPIIITLQLAGVTVVVLMIFGIPISWWLAHTRTRFRPFFEAVIALPLVLPPTVLGFYLLILLGPDGWIGKPVEAMSGSTLSFTFTGLVIASTFYSLPFVVQPLYNTFETIGKDPLEAAWTLGASKWDAFWTVASPMALRGYMTAIVMGFAHTLGEFGVVLMVGGSIPGKTKVLSIEIYDKVETLDYNHAHLLSGGLLAFTFLVLLTVYYINRKFPINVS